MKKSIWVLLVLTATVYTLSCSKSSGGGGGGTTSCNLNVSFSSNIKNILDANCSGCHNPTTGTDANAKSLWPYDGSFSSASGRKTDISSLVASGQMPKTGGLPQATRDSITCWVSKGAPN